MLIHPRLAAWFTAHPEIKIDGPSPLEHFAMHAVGRLASAFAFNDEIGADQPDHKELLLDRIVRGAGGPDQFAAKFGDLDDEDL